MTTKRSAPYVDPSRRDQVPSEPRRKKQKPNNAGPQSFKKAHPVNELKSQVRSLKRLLERNDDLPADVRVEKERALQNALHDLEETQRAKTRSDMIGRYHKIRFFDRQKATKRLKRARKELQAHEGDKEARRSLSKVVEDGEVDVNYSQYFPLDEHYIPLFPRKKSEHEDEDEETNGEVKQGSREERRGDHEMWLRVKKCMKDGTLEALRNGRFTRNQRKEVIENGKPMSTVNHGDKKVRKSAHPVNGKEAESADDESDGGFFE